MTTGWTSTWRPARLEERLPDGVVKCHLSPRGCVIREGRDGFCRVRGNRDGRLVTMNFGKGVHPAEETIETEAVNHFAPGMRILSLGNVGCMLNCDYCHNWKTSQARHVSDRDVVTMTPEEVVAMATRHGIRCLSWTYNDPVVWHEFVLETSLLARAAGMTTLFKSAFFITPEAIEELLPVIDIFSISVKSMDPQYYRRLTKGWLEPVLEGVRICFAAGKHVEVSTLMVTDVSDDEATARSVARFVLDDLAPSVPLHFVRFHPDYKMAAGERTPIPRLMRARELALEMGVEHVYLGNVHDPEVTNTRCRGCGALLVARFGLHARVVGLAGQGRCKACSRDAHVKMASRPSDARAAGVPGEGPAATRVFSWHGDIRSLHVQARAGLRRTALSCRRLGEDADPAWTHVPLEAGESFRFLIAKATPGETGVELAVPEDVSTNLHEVFDRAHYPTVPLEAGSAPTDRVPLPLFVKGATAAEAACAD